MLLFVLFMYANYGKVVLFKFILELFCSSTVRHDTGALYKVTRHFQMLSTTASFFLSSVNYGPHFLLTGTGYSCTIF